MRFVISLILVAAVARASANLDPFHSPASARVFIFARTDCPLIDRYAPELRRIAAEFQSRGVAFWLVYPGRSASPSAIAAHAKEYSLPGTVIADPDTELVRRAHARVAPEAAVFDRKGQLVYHGRIDNRWVDFGKARPAATVHDLETAIADVLGGRPVPEAATRAVGCSLADLQ